MRVLLDECLDWRLGRAFPEHTVKTVREMRWNGIVNGKLLALAKEQFDVFVTVDGNLAFQQNLAEYPIGIIVLRAKRIRLPDLLTLVPQLRAGIIVATPGKPVIVGESIPNK